MLEPLFGLLHSWLRSQIKAFKALAVLLKGFFLSVQCQDLPLRLLFQKSYLFVKVLFNVFVRFLLIFEVPGELGRELASDHRGESIVAKGIQKQPPDFLWVIAKHWQVVHDFFEIVLGERVQLW